MDDDGETKSDNTIKPANDKRIKSDTLKKSPQKIDLSRQDLVRLLSYLEGELQARDVVISTIKSETAKQLLYQAKYGRLGLNDPLAALQRDSETCGSTDDFDESSVGQMYESQLGQLEKLIAVQRRAHHRAKQVLAGAERRHAKTVRELDDERQRRAQDAAQGDDVCMMLEKERERLKQEIEVQKNEQDKLEKELEKLKQSLLEEKDRRKEIVLYLLQERRQLMVRLMEERLKVQNLTGAPSQTASTSFKSADESMLAKLKSELEATKNLLEKERDESASLREIVRTQEDDLNLIRQTILAKTRRMNEQQKQSNGDRTVKNQTNSATPTISKPSTGQAPSTTSSGTVRYQILTRPAAPGSVETSPKFVADSTNQNQSPLQSPSSTIRLLNPAYQPQLSPQSKNSKQNSGPPSYSMSIAGVGVDHTTNYSSAMKVPANQSQYAAVPSSSTSTTTYASSPASLRRPLINSPVKTSTAPVSVSLVNGFSKDPKRSNGAGSSYASIYSSIGSTVRAMGSSTPACESDSLRLGSTNRVALTQLPANFTFPSQRNSVASSTTPSTSSTASIVGGDQTKRKTSGNDQTQVSFRSSNLEKTVKTRNNNPVTISSDDLNIEPEIAHLEAVINSMAAVDDRENDSEFEFDTDSASHRPSGVEEQQNFSENESNRAQNSNTINSSWSTISRRFPTNLSSTSVGNRSTTSTTNSITSANNAPMIMSKRAPTPSPNNRIPLPLNGVLTKSFSTSSASAGSISSKAEMEPGLGGRSSSTVGNRMTKAMSGIAGKVQKKMAPNVKRSDPVRSTQV